MQIYVSYFSPSVLILVFRPICVYVFLYVRHGGADADAKCPDAPNYNAQHDAESPASHGLPTGKQTDTLWHI